MSASESNGRPAGTEYAGEDRRSAFAGGRRSRWIGRFFGLIWLFFLVYPIEALLGSDVAAGRVAVALFGTVVFVGIYLWLLLFCEPARRKLCASDLRKRLAAIVGLSVLALALNLAYSAEYIGLFIYASVAAGVMLPERSAYALIGGLTILMAAVGWVAGMGWVDIGQFVLLTGGVGVGQVLWVRLLATVTELRAAREEIARLAVNEERLRFARDLHDLLGHSLSLIALKTDVISRLLPDSPERAAAEARDAEVVAREALREVRAAVTGYRRPTLLTELAAAREVLGAAGIGYNVEGEEMRPPTSAEEVLAWAVREGITNVVRHSRARRCAIRLELDGDEAFLEVVDDGVGVLPVGPDADGAGSGLAGLRERAAAAGGALETGSGPGGGFRLRVSVPVDGERAADGGNDGPGDGSAPGRSTTGDLLA